MKKVFLFALSALMLAGCQSDNSEQIAVGEGRIAITATTSGAVETRAEGVTLSTPQLSEFSLKITGTDFSKSWSSLTDYRSEEERYTAGNYTVSILYGDSTVEGIDKPCFADTKEVTVLDRNRTTEVAMTAKLANAIVAVKTTKAFDNYFPTSNFTVKTATNNFDIDLKEEKHLFVAAGQAVDIDCTCIRQSNMASGKQETLPTHTIPATAATTRYVVTYDLTTAGGVAVTVTLNDTVIGTIDIENELNPNA